MTMIGRFHHHPPCQLFQPFQPCQLRFQFWFANFWFANFPRKAACDSFAPFFQLPAEAKALFFSIAALPEPATEPVTMLPLRDEMPRALFIPELLERLALLPRFCVPCFPDIHDRADFRPEADLRPENERMPDPERSIADLPNLLPLNERRPENLLLRMPRPLKRAPPPLKLRMPPPLKLRMPPPLKLRMPPPLKLRMPPPLPPPKLRMPPPPPGRASAIATEKIAATRAITATDAIRFSFESEGAMVRTAGTPLLRPSRNFNWRSHLSARCAAVLRLIQKIAA